MAAGKSISEFRSRLERICDLRFVIAGFAPSAGSQAIRNCRFAILAVSVGRQTIRNCRFAILAGNL